MIDLYFEPAYGKLYEKVENGTCEIFEYKCSFGTVSHMFIKREIPIDRSFHDIITPYGYGGPIITVCQEGRKSELVNEFIIAFKHYCENNRIVSEFVRFHPIIGNVHDFSSIYEVKHIRNTIGTNLVAYEDPIQSEFSKSCKKNIKKALRMGVDFRITEQPKDLHDFQKIYYSTMRRNEAAEYYFFGDDYFNKCLKLLGTHIVTVEAIYQEQTIAMGLYFIYNKTIHIHLSGTFSSFLDLSPAYILRYAVTKWGKENGYHLIHHGGGRSNTLDDNLYKFKKQFGKNTEFEFYIGKKVWNAEVYEQLCKFVNVDESVDFFPAYRVIKEAK
jgi:serine/alanine adding enzyme